MKNEDLVKDAEEIVRHPSHYCDGRKYEPIDVFNDWGCFFSIGNGLKYLSRAGRKIKDKTIEDLQKALFYLKYELEHKSQPVKDDEPNYSIHKVLEDWKLSENISKAVSDIYNYILSGNEVNLASAIVWIENEIKELK